jgi:hypothetical protein
MFFGDSESSWPVPTRAVPKSGGCPPVLDRFFCSHRNRDRIVTAKIEQRDSYIEDTVTGLSLPAGLRKTVIENVRCQIIMRSVDI